MIIVRSKGRSKKMQGLVAKGSTFSAWLTRSKMATAAVYYSS